MGEEEHREAESEAEVSPRRRSSKRRKLYNEAFSYISSQSCEASSQLGFLRKSTEIKASSHFDAFYVQNEQPGFSEGVLPSDRHPHFQHTGGVLSLSAPPDFPFSPSHAPAQLEDAKSIIHKHIEDPQTATHIKIPHGVGGLSPCLSPTDTQIKRGLSSTRTLNKRSQGTPTPSSHNLYPLHTHHLPHDLIISNIVASRMPLINLIRSRIVCRAWRDAIFSPVFAKSFCANVDSQRPRLVIEHSSSSGPSLAVFDPLVQGWSIIPAPSFGRLVAASSGLFCYVTEAGRPPSLVVGNVLTNLWKHLPAIPLCVPAHGPQMVAMIANKPEGSYKVMVLFGMWDDDASDAYLPFMYDSMLKSWTCKSTILARLSFAASRSVVKTPENILLSVDSNAGNLLSYDINNNVGHSTQLKHLPSFINEEDQKMNLWRRLPQVAVCEGAVFLVARCTGERIPECNLGQLPIVQHSSVGIWKMQANADEWQFITRVPLDLLQKIVKGSDGTDFIIASNSASTLFFVLKGSPHMLAYDSTLHTWNLLPGCPADYNSYPLHQSAFYEPLLWLTAV